MFDWRDEGERLCARLGTERVKEAVGRLSDAYREGRGTAAPRLDGESLMAAYLGVRFPATRAANLAVARAIDSALERRAGIEGFQPRSLLDLGAGCGAAASAYEEAWPSLTEVTAVEQLAPMIRMGKQVLPAAVWRHASIEAAGPYARHDAVVISYALGEAGAGVFDLAWEASGQLLIVIEPGTPHGFATILAARERLIALGASILAPCPSHGTCPAAGVDWCHFATRLERSALHRRLKGGTLGYEDEKYSYVAAWRGSLAVGAPRVIRHPLIQAGWIEAEVCEAPARGKVIATKRDKERFRRFRKLKWGDEL